MMDGQVAAIRQALTQTDTNNSRSWRIQRSTPLLNMDRPETVDVTITGGGNRKAISKIRHGREAMEEIRLDIAEGATLSW